MLRDTVFGNQQSAQTHIVQAKQRANVDGGSVAYTHYVQALHIGHKFRNNIVWLIAIKLQGPKSVC